MANTSVTENHSGGQSVITTEVNGVRTVVTKNLLPNVYRGDLLAKIAYRTQKIWNPATNAYVTVTMTGNQAQDAAALALAFVTTGTLTNSVIAQT